MGKTRHKLGHESRIPALRDWEPSGLTLFDTCVFVDACGARDNDRNTDRHIVLANAALYHAKNNGGIAISQEILDEFKKNSGIKLWVFSLACGGLC